MRTLIYTYLPVFFILEVVGTFFLFAITKDGEGVGKKDDEQSK